MTRPEPICGSGSQGDYLPGVNSVADTAEARRFVDLRRLELRWSTAQFQAQVETLGATSIPSVAKGRAMLLKHDLAITLGEVSELLMRPNIDSTTRREAQQIQEQTKELANSADQWLAVLESDHTDLPANHSSISIGLD